jgi:hypothetical protein
MQSRWADLLRGRSSGRIRRLVASTVVAVVSSVGAIVATAQPAQAAGVPAPIHNYDSGMCLQPVPTVGASIYDNGIPIWQVPCNGSAEQSWKKILTEKPRSGDCNVYWFLGFPVGFSCGFDRKYYESYLVNQKTLSCIDVTDARSDNGTVIQQWQCNDGDSEKWMLPQSDNAVGSYLGFLNSRTGKCLDVPWGTLAASPIQQYECSHVDNGAQRFEIPPN